jgi:4-hydroxybenzoate polyprenyltransferase
MGVAGMGVALTSLVTPSVLITAGAIVLVAFTDRYDKLGDRLKSGETGVTRLKLRVLRVSIIAVLIGLCSLALSVVALTLAVVLRSGALTYLTVALVLLGAERYHRQSRQRRHRPSASPGLVNP